MGPCCTFEDIHVRGQHNAQWFHIIDGQLVAVIHRHMQQCASTNRGEIKQKGNTISSPQGYTQSVRINLNKTKHPLLVSYLFTNILEVSRVVIVLVVYNWSVGQ